MRQRAARGILLFTVVPAGTAFSVPGAAAKEQFLDYVRRFTREFLQEN
jgi:hypothetical protein